jgi:hypothetical protein
VSGQGVLLRRKITHAQDFLPIPPAPIVIKGQLTGTRTHLPGGQGGKVHTRPTLFNCLAMSPANTFRIVKRVVGLARCTVTGKMEFGNEIGQLQAADIEIGVVS